MHSEPSGTYMVEHFFKNSQRNFFCLPIHLQGVLQDALKASSKFFEDVFSSRLEDVLEINKYFLGILYKLS